ncbi:MAG: aminotransferase class V-fold PLP-dependent enzyme, partial [Candidatus Omnitrophota bacterium]
MKKVYFDYAATTPTDPEVLAAMEPYFFDKFGNASSLHAYGQEAKKAIEDSRQALSEFIGASPEEIVFTSGGTESDNFALLGSAYALEKKGNHIITSAI